MNIKIHVYRFPGIFSAALLFLMVYFGFVQPSEWVGVIRVTFYIFLGVTAVASLVGVFVLAFCSGLLRNYYAARGYCGDSARPRWFLTRVVISALPVLFGLRVFWADGHTVAFSGLLVLMISMALTMILHRYCRRGAGARA